jgi:hypothetical protein
MRRFFKALPVALLVLVVSVIAGASQLPRSRTLERSLVIEAPAAEVYGHLAHIRKWRGWYVGPDAGTFEGPEHGAGGVLVVRDPESRELRRLELVATSSPTHVAYRFPEADQAPYDIEGHFDLQVLGPERTRVVSRQKLRARAGDDAWLARTGERWFLYAFADRFVGSILLRELHNLKAAVEGLPPPGGPGE